jgi:hypothetical protein
MIVADFVKIRWDMAILAAAGGCGVVRWFPNRLRIVVARTATLRRSFEPTAHMARCALNCGMRANQWKRRSPMIKAASSLLG